MTSLLQSSAVPQALFWILIAFSLCVVARFAFIVGHAFGREGSAADVKRLQASTSTALENEARAKQDATDLRTLVLRYEQEAAESNAIQERIWAGVQKRLHMEHSRIVVTLPDCTSDSEAANEIVGLLIGPDGRVE